MHDTEVLVGFCKSRQRVHRTYLVSDPDSVSESFSQVPPSIKDHNPGKYQTVVASFPCFVNQIIPIRFSDSSINKFLLVLCNQCLLHRSSPCVVICTSQWRRNETIDVVGFSFGLAQKRLIGSCTGFRVEGGLFTFRLLQEGILEDYAPQSSKRSSDSDSVIP